MKDGYKEKTEELIRALGGVENIRSVSNCMTRLRTEVRDEALVDEEGLRSLVDVMGLVHDRERLYEIVVGPGKCRKYADECHALGLVSRADDCRETDKDWKQFKSEVRSRQKDNRLKSGLKMVGDIFVPLIPGIITAGLCAGFAALLRQAVPDYEKIRGWSILYQLLMLVNVSFMTYLTAWVGYRAAERFGATPILGGMLGMITSLEGINEISRLLGLYNEESPLNSVLRMGKGGVLSVIIGVFLLSVIEKKIRSWMPESVDIIFTPLLSLLSCVIPYILVIMPLLGYVSGGIVWVFSKMCMSGNMIVRIAAGYVSALLFLPLVAAGMHHGLVALYSVQLQELGYVTLYPALAMAGAGQVGTAIALWMKARQVGNRKLCSVIAGALPAGFLGIGEPLIYGVTLPLGKPFFTAGLGAGFGGALVMAFEVASTTWGPSGLLGMFVMTAGPQGAIRSVLIYLAALVVSYLASFIITALAIHKQDLKPNSVENLRSDSSDASRQKKAAEKTDTAEKRNAAGQTDSGEQTNASGQTYVVEKANISEQADIAGQTYAAQQKKAAHAATEEAFLSGAYHVIRHGERIFLGEGTTKFAYTLKDPDGIHARPAGKLAELVRGYDCEVTVCANGRNASAVSVLELMNLGAGQGTVLTIEAKGNDAKTAIRDVKEFLRQSL